MFLHNQMSWYDRLLYCLQGKSNLVPSSMSEEEALMQLILQTGEDFGYDVAAWKQWFDANRANLDDICQKTYERVREELKHGKNLTEITEEIRREHKQ